MKNQNHYFVSFTATTPKGNVHVGNRIFTIDYFIDTPEDFLRFDALLGEDIQAVYGVEVKWVITTFFLL